MRLTLLRHGKAVERDEWTGDDADRPLTRDGIVHAHETMIALASLVVPVMEATEIWTSPWRRARHTAELAASVWELPLREVPWLAGDHTPVDQWPAPPATGHIFVGHEPELSRLLLRLCGFTETGLTVELRKAGVAILDGEPVPGGMELYALIPPKIARKLGR
ncbi:hypothetical protein LBMAG53_33250 [Planctomycetota bacterium]|nr:hypothetical protein LBMAG53_33250 [Planctomycetota bacterium]